MTLDLQLSFALDIVGRLLEEDRLDRARLHDVLRHARHPALRYAHHLVDDWLKGEGWRGDLEAIAQVHEARQIAVELVAERDEELPELVARAVAGGQGRLSFRGGLVLLTLAGGVETRTARWQARYLKHLLQELDVEMADLIGHEPGWAGAR